MCVCVPGPLTPHPYEVLVTNVLSPCKRRMEINFHFNP